MSKALDLSVVIPTKDRWPVLEGMLEALSQQDLEGLTVEVIVIDNGSSDGTLDRVREGSAGRWRALSLRALREEAPGAAAARNVGIAAASGGLVLFLGDDCRPAQPRVLAGHVEAHRRGLGQPKAVVGAVAWDPAIERTPVMDWLTESGAIVNAARLAREAPGPWAMYAGNLSLPRRALLSVAGFDERFGGYGFEDFELGLRLAERGIAVEYRAQLAVHHAHRYTGAESVARMEAVGQAANLLHRLHDHRRPLPGPKRTRTRLMKGRLLAPMARRADPPRLLPDRLRKRWFDAVHLAAFARGYLGPALADDPAHRGYRVVPPPDGAERPPVSVIVPFLGDRRAAEAALAALGRLAREPDDEVVLVDNTADGVAAQIAQHEVRVVPATEQRSSYYARNVGAESTTAEWLLFLDADCRPAAGLLDDLFREPIPSRCAVVAGSVRGAPEQTALAARYARARGHLSQAAHLRDRHRPFAITANLLVRRAAWAAAGGFPEHLRSGGDADLCWTLQEAGWALVYREPAAVEHLHRARVSGLAAQAARYSAAIAWMGRRRRGSSPRPRVSRRVARSAAGVLGSVLLARFEGASFAALDGVVSLAEGVGYLDSNRAQLRVRTPPPATSPALAIVVDRFPERSQTFVAAEAAALQRRGCPVTVYAAWRSRHPDRLAARALPVRYLEDVGIARRALDLCWMVARAPLACVRDLGVRGRWRREEPVRPLRALAPLARQVAGSGARHVHAHFADAAALDALRLARLVGVSFSVTAHAYDIFASPANLREKLERAAFVSTGCSYNVQRLRRVVDARSADRIHEINMGVDSARFRRATPYPGGRHVVAIGRLVEKKGFRLLIEAAAQLERSRPLERVSIVGEGPLHAELAALVARCGLEGVVELCGPRQHDEIKQLLEEADLLAMPSVVAADGDRDSMPVVVKEALAMEVPVVASDEVGLPELVRPAWGRLVPPGDARQLAEAIAELLDLPAPARASMGAAGRAWVCAHCDVDREAAKLERLIDVAIGSRSGSLDHQRPEPHRAPRDGHQLDEVVQRVVGSRGRSPAVDAPALKQVHPVWHPQHEREGD